MTQLANTLRETVDLVEYKMLKRTISGAVYVLIVLSFFILREYVDYRLFNILIAFFSAVGTFEVARALKSRILNFWDVICSVFGILIVPYFTFVSYSGGAYKGALYSFLFTLLVIIVAFVWTLCSKNKIKIFLVTLVPLLYPSTLLLFWCLINESLLGFIGLLLIFVVSALSDTFAYLIGMTYGKIRKGNVKKLCPKLSPKKTVAGAIGALIGGIIGGVAIALIFMQNIFVFAVVGLVGSIFTQIGDLFESYIKRRVGIKDMGKIMPGHGGVMDRIDGMVFVGVLGFIYIALVVLVL